MKIEEIKKILKENKKTYADLSNACGLPIGTLRNIFAGFTKNPRLDTMEKIETGLQKIIPEKQNDVLGEPYISTDEEHILNVYRQLSSRDKMFFLKFVNNFNVDNEQNSISKK